MYTTTYTVSSLKISYVYWHIYIYANMSWAYIYIYIYMPKYFEKEVYICQNSYGIFKEERHPLTLHIYVYILYIWIYIYIPISEMQLLSNWLTHPAENGDLLVGKANSILYRQYLAILPWYIMRYKKGLLLYTAWSSKLGVEESPLWRHTLEGTIHLSDAKHTLIPRWSNLMVCMRRPFPKSNTARNHLYRFCLLSISSLFEASATRLWF